jgi:hypothetical protein
MLLALVIELTPPGTGSSCGGRIGSAIPKIGSRNLWNG